jgi:hypothetical protein
MVKLLVDEDRRHVILRQDKPDSDAVDIWYGPTNKEDAFTKLSQLSAGIVECDGVFTVAALTVGIQIRPYTEK